MDERSAAAGGPSTSRPSTNGASHAATIPAATPQSTVARADGGAGGAQRRESGGGVGAQIRKLNEARVLETALDLRRSQRAIDAFMSRTLAAAEGESCANPERERNDLLDARQRAEHRFAMACDLVMDSGPQGNDPR